MKKSVILRPYAMATAAIAIALVMSACSSTKTAKSPEASANSSSLEYKMATTNGYSYSYESGTEQYMDIQGQAVSVSSTTVVGFHTANLKNENGLLMFDVVIDTAGIKATSMMENIDTDLKLKGKSFVMSVKPTGKVISYGEAANIEFSAGTGGESDLSSMFTGVLPVLTKKDAKPGDIWISIDTTETKSRTNQFTTISTGTYTFLNFVTLNGRNCAQISSMVEGTRKGTIVSQGMDLLMYFPFKGTETIWFDLIEGVVVKYDSSIKGNGEIEVSGMDMVIPVSMTASSTLELKK